MKKIALSGSIVYDHLFQYKGEFKNSLQEGSLDDISLCLRTHNHVMRFGGCAGNIAYNLALMDAPFYLYGVVGRDFKEYKEHLDLLKVDFSAISVDDKEFTANAYIMSDHSENQLGIFSPGASDNTNLAMNINPEHVNEISLGIVSPCNPSRMLSMAQSFLKNKIPFIFDPGQAMPAMSDDDLNYLVANSIGVIVNRYEGSLLNDRIKMSLDAISEKAGFLIQTLGDEGCKLYIDATVTDIPAITDYSVVDVTGAGDAFRAGFLYGYLQKKDIKRCCEFGSTLASFSVNGDGGQSHDFNVDDFYNRLEGHFG